MEMCAQTIETPDRPNAQRACSLGFTCKFVLSALVLLLASPHTHAGTVHTRDNKTYTGNVRLEANSVTVTPTGTPPLRFDLNQIREATFEETATQPHAHAPTRGLRGEYFGDKELKNLMFLRVDPSIDFNWDRTLPHPFLPREFAARWTGQIEPRYSEEYTFIAHCDDGVRLWIDGKLIIDKWRAREASDWTATIPLQAGRKYDFKMEYFHSYGRSRARLSWASNRQQHQVIPETCLNPPASDPAAPGLRMPAIATDGSGNLLRVILPATTGLRGEYYDGTNFEKLKFIRRDANLDFTYSHGQYGPPDTAVSRNFCVRWTAQLVPLYSEKYTLYLGVDDGVRLWVDGRLLLDKWNNHHDEFAVQLDLVAGQKHDLHIDYFQADGEGEARLAWSSKSQRREIIPSNCFLPPKDDRTPPIVAIVSPTEWEMPVAPEQVIIESATQGEGADRVQIFDGHKLIGEATSRPFRLAWNRPTPGKHILLATVTDANGLTAVSDPVRITVADNGRGTFPQPWANQPLGDKGSSFSRAMYANGVFTIQTAGGDLLYEEDDACQFVYQPLTGDGQIVARLARLQPADPASGVLAGVMIRESMRTDAKRISMLLAPNSALFVRRTNTGYRPESTNKEAEPPCWLKLVRHGNEFRGYTSADGRIWSLQGVQRLDMQPDTFVGLTAVTGDKETWATASFDHVEAIAGSPPMEFSAKGFLTRSGTFLACEVYAADETSIHFKRQSKSATYPINDVSRIVYRPVLTEMAGGMRGPQNGVLLASGDFLDGQIKSIRDGHLSISSVLFGLKQLELKDEVMAVALRASTALSAPYTLRTADGTTFQARTISTDNNQILLDDTSLGMTKFPASEIRLLQVRQ